MEKRFAFRGSAIGAAGHIHKPEDLIISVQAASTIPVIGGYSRAKVKRMKFGDVLSFDSARTQATGDFRDADKAYTTLANAVVKGLNINGRLTADSVEVTLSAAHPATGKEATISVPDPEFTNLRLDGYSITVTIDDDICSKYVTRDSLTSIYTTNDAFFKRYAGRFQKSEKDKTTSTEKGKRQIPEVGGYIVTSIVSKIETKHPKAVVSGNVITLNGFGRIFLGELLITNGSRRLTMLRLKLGSPIEGEVACAEVETNGIILI